ncbi:MAG: TRAP transporter substrate-binding protein [Proteobacteria bacterium]|nr:TRAP transporter substrate-binding protein [Pseudomonadota bacterium]
MYPTLRLLVATALAAALATNAMAQQFTMKISSPTINDVTQQWAKEFAASLKARVGDQIKVEFYPASQLGQIPATVQGTAMGTIEAVAPASGFLVGLDPRFQVFDAPGLFASLEEAQRTFADPAVRKRLASFAAGKGMEMIAVYPHGPVMLVSHKAIHKVADFKDQKIRVPGAVPLQVEPFRKLGALPVSMPLGEVLSAMQNHTIDGVAAAAAVFTAFKYYDLAKGMTRLPGSYLVVPVMANKGFMDSLGPKLAGAVRDAAFDAQKKVEVFDRADIEKTFGVWKQHGGEVIELSTEQQANYLAQVQSVLPALMKASPSLKDDYDFLRAAAARHHD